MKKIGILSIFANYNHGSSLQVYALQKTIEKFEPDCEIIDYQSDILREVRPSYKKRPLYPKDILKSIFRLPYAKKLLKRDQLFDDFFNFELKRGPLCRTEQEVIEQAGNYECIVCGSDQGWNLDPAGRYFNMIYYLNFPKKQRRVTYATSFGDWVEKLPQCENEVLPWIQTYDMLSMRERSGVSYLQSKGFDCKLVLDPTLLLKVEEYKNIEEETAMTKYVLLLSWIGSKDALHIAKDVANKLGLKIVCIMASPKHIFSGVKRKLDVGPKEFLGLIKNATFVVTDAFHGAVFSIQYEKPFVSVNNGNFDTRRQSLLSQLGLESHYLRPLEVDFDKIMSTDFAPTKRKLESLKDDSIAYLKKAIGVSC
ncbi:MAG: polysaccharide pyruvyl transferase family protein [Holosporales bacterium]|jgi:polysaccharide pyruvyl transferase WcaK-like protein|nr:polysaccharide pyruvyl transferase family protein [Holosporales bacterium]